MEMSWKDEMVNIERKIVQEEVFEDEKRHLKFVQVGKRAYKVFNQRTNRFHNLELGIDIVM